MDANLPAVREWEQIAKSFKINDNGLEKAVDDFRRLREDEFDKRLALLAQIGKLATALIKTKEAVTAGSKVIKFLQNVVAAATRISKEVAADKKAAEESGEQKVQVQIIAVNWEGEPLDAYTGFVEFKSPKAPKVVKVTEAIDGGVMDLGDLAVMSSGTVRFTAIKTQDTGIRIDGVSAYEIKPGGKLLKLKAIQHSQKGKTTAKTIAEVTKKLGLKGEVGVEFKIFKVGGEVTKEEEKKEGKEEEIEYEIEKGLPTFKEFNQIS